MKYRVIAILWMSFIVSTVFPEERNDKLQTRIDSVLQGKNATVGVAVLSPDNSLFEMNRGDYPMMSVCKFPLALAVLDHLQRSGLSLDTELYISKADLLPDTYSPLRDRYPQGNIKMSIRDLLVYTISLSDNNACDVLFNYVGGANVVNDYIRALGIKGMSVVATEKMMHEDVSLQYRNATTPSSAVLLLDKFLKENLWGDEYKNCLKNIMVATATGADKIKAGLPEGTVIGHKTGSSGRNAEGVKAGDNDLAFVQLPDGRYYCIAVFVRDSKEDDKTNAAIIAAISRIVYDYVVKK